MDGHSDGQLPVAEQQSSVPKSDEATDREAQDLAGAIGIMVAETGGALAGVGLTHAQFVLLLAVSEFEPVELDFLSRIMAVGERRSPAELAPLVEKGTVCINEDESLVDRVAITAHGRNLLQRAIPLWEAAQDRIQDRLGVRRVEPDSASRTKKPVATG